MISGFSLFNHITAVGDLNHGNDYSLFKKGIQPKWEDEKNHNGGRWLLSVEGRSKQHLNEWWLNLVSIYLFCYDQCMYVHIGS